MCGLASCYSLPFSVFGTLMNYNELRISKYNHYKNQIQPVIDSPKVGNMNTVDQSSNNNADESDLANVLRQWVAEKRAFPSERILAQQLNVKRHQLRKALQALKVSGELPASSPRKLPSSSKSGAALVRGTNPLEVLELRLALEPVLARLAALRATPLDIANIERAATTLAGTESGSADLAFHKLIAAATHNTLAADFYALLRQVGSDSRLRVESPKSHCPDRLRQRDEEHHAIAAAIASRDPNKAEEAMRAHLNMVQRLVLNRIAP